MAGIRRVSDLGTRGWSNILDGSIVTADLANSSVTTAKIADNNITQAKLDTSIPINGFKNGIINGSFDVWQRANSATFTPTVNVARYDTADRWAIINGNVVSSITTSRVAADNSFLNYGMQWGRAAGQTNTGPLVLAYNMESLDARKYAGKQVTISFWLKRGTGTSPTTLSFNAFTATGTDQSTTLWWTTGWTGQVKIVDVNISPTTTMTRYQYTFTAASNTNQMIFVWFYTPSGTASGEFIQIEGVQFEEGAVASPFERRPFGTELQLCQRYYEHNYGTGYAVGSAAAYPYNQPHTGINGYTVANQQKFLYSLYMVPKRRVPDITIYDTAGNNGKLTTLDAGGTGTTNVTVGISSTTDKMIGYAPSAGTYAGYVYFYVASAEL